MLHLEQLEDRLSPVAIVPHGGPVLVNPRLINVGIGVSTASPDALAGVLTGPYGKLLTVYGIGPASLVGSVTLPPAGPLTNADVISLLQKGIDSGSLPPADGNSLYLVYLPQQVTDSWAQNDAGYHSYLTLSDGRQVAYGVVWMSSEWTRAASHEYAEAVTDPFFNAWYGNNSYEEIGDIYNASTFHYAGWTLQVLARPDGSPEQLSFSPGDVFALAVSELYRDVWTLVARLLPAFTSEAGQATQAVQANPAYGTPEGDWAMAVADQVFLSL